MKLMKCDQIIRRPTKEDVDFLIKNMREDDKIEIAALGGRSPKECMDGVPDLDKNAYVWEYSGKVMCIFGVNPIKEKIGIIWLLGTKFFDEHGKVFIFRCKEVFDEVLAPYEYVFNYVYVENKKSVRWLKWLGFEIEEAEPIGVNGALFHRFEKWNDNV